MHNGVSEERALRLGKRRFAEDHGPAPAGVGAVGAHRT